MDKNKSKLSEIIYVGIFVSIISVLSLFTIPLPFSLVPITLQTFGVMLVGCLLKPKLAFYVLVIYIMIGAVGIPVFSGFQSGIGTLVGPTGGYIIAFLIGAVLISVISKNSLNFWRLFTANIIGGILVIHLIGTFWLAYSTSMGLKQAFLVGSIPYLIGDILKALLAAQVAIIISKRVFNNQ